MKALFGILLLFLIANQIECNLKLRELGKKAKKAKNSNSNTNTNKINCNTVAKNYTDKVSSINTNCAILTTWLGRADCQDAEEAKYFNSLSSDQ